MREDVQLIPLGGVNEIGKNMYALRYEDEIIVIDAGVMFPDDEMLGIDYVIPDMSYLIDNKEKVKAIFITHGHEDHIGALAYFLQEVDVPVYGTTLALGLARPKLAEFNLSDSKFREIQIGDRISEGSFQVEFIRVNHSIPDGAALAITTPAGVIIHSGDFKFDQTPIDNQVTDYHRFADYGDSGVLALLCDSTNANKEGYTPSEKEVGVTIDGILNNNTNRILMATFASNIHRIQQAFTLAKKHNRKVAVIGRSMVNNVETASNLGYLDVPENTLIDINQIDNYSPEQLLILCTGSQGEPLAALTRMAYNRHYQISIGAFDTIIMSSNPIPGNEKLVNRVINGLTKNGATVITSKNARVHVSGHASAEEIKMMFHLVKPKYIIPFHGEYQQKHACREIALSLGYEKDNVFLMENGDVLEINDRAASIVDTVEAGRILIDGRGIGDVGRIVLRDRHLLAQYGVLTCIVVISADKQAILSGPTIITRGFVFVKESEDLINEAISLVDEAINDLLKSGKTGWAPLKNKMRQVLQDYLYEETGRKPMILPIIMEV
ncbi:MAG: ribonuclease J [Clostridia bacterium]